MKHWRNLITKRQIGLGVGIIIVLAAGCYGSIIVSRPWRAARAAQYLSSAQTEITTNPKRSASDIQLALFVSPNNEAAASWAADLYLQLGQTDPALEELKRLPVESGGGRLADVYLKQRRFTEATEVLNKLLMARQEPLWLTQRAIATIEQGSGENALGDLKTAYRATPTPSIALLTVLVALATGHRDLALQITTPDADTQGEINAAIANPIILGRLLYEHGLPATAKTVLIGTDETSTVKFLILARIELEQGSGKTNFDQAIGYLNSGLELDPSDLSLNRGLLEVYEFKHDDAAAKTQQGMLDRITAGTP